MTVKKNIGDIKTNVLDILKKKQPVLFDYSAYLKKTVPSLIESIVIDQYELELVVKKENLKNLLFFLKKHTNAQYEVLTDIIGADFPARKNRFQITYHLLSVNYSSRMRVVTFTDEITPLDSVADIFSVANWQEREVYDMFGVFFDNHPDLRRILTDYGFEGHPLRKDFPLSGFYEVFYDDREKRIVRAKVSLAQEYRNFKFNNPWKESNK